MTNSLLFGQRQDPVHAVLSCQDSLGTAILQHILKLPADQISFCAQFQTIHIAAASCFLNRPCQKEQILNLATVRLLTLASRISLFEESITSGRSCLMILLSFYKGWGNLLLWMRQAQGNSNSTSKPTPQACLHIWWTWGSHDCKSGTITPLNTYIQPNDLHPVLQISGICKNKLPAYIIQEFWRKSRIQSAHFKGRPSILYL